MIFSTELLMGQFSVIVGDNVIVAPVFLTFEGYFDDEFATLEFIPPKYQKYKNVFEEFEKKKKHCQYILKTITKSFWKHRKNWQPVLFTP